MSPRSLSPLARVRVAPGKLMAVKLKDALVTAGVALVVLVDVWDRLIATERTTRAKTAGILCFKVFFSFFTDFWAHWAVATIAVPLFAATAQNLTHRDATPFLLKRYQDLNYAGPFLQGLKRFSDDRAKYAAAFGSYRGRGA